MADSTVTEALERFKEGLDAESTVRTMMREDQDFLAGNQWPSEVKAARARDLVGGPRPCLVMDKLSQYLRQIVNDARQNRPGVKVRGVEDGDPEVAGVFQGLTRNIEDVSRADIAYDRALECAAGIGRGWLRLNTMYVRPEASFQDIRILSLPDPFAVVPDADYREPDGSDMKYCFVSQDIKRKTYEKLYPRGAMTSLDFADGWVTTEYIRVAEYYSIYNEAKKLLRLQSGDEVFEDVYKEMQERFGEALPEVNSSRDVDLPRVKWCKINSSEILEETEWLGRWIPVVPVHGNEMWVDGKRMLSGMVRPAKDPQRLYNYSRSAYAELVALAPKAPFVLAEGQVEGYEDTWGSANRVSHAYLPYKPVDVSGHQVPPPQRQPYAGVPAGLAQDMAMAEHDIQSSLGMYAPSIGQPSNERSGKAIVARQREGDVGSFHYRDNLGRSIRHVGRILVDLIPKIYDTRRVLRILGEDGTESQVITDPRAPRAVSRQQLPNGKVQKIYNLDVGTYDVTVSAGPGYATKREEAANAIMQLTQAAPQLFGVVGDLLVKSMDWPYADEIARRLKLLLPPVLKTEEDGQAQPLPPEAQQKIMQLTQALQQVTQQAQQIQEERAKLKGIVDGKVIDHQIKREEAQTKMAELAFKEKELVVKEEELAIERARIMDEGAIRQTEAQAKFAEAMAPTTEAMSAERDMDQITSIMQEGFGQIVTGLGQMQEALQQMGQGVLALGAKLEEHAGGTREHISQSLAAGETRSLKAIERIVKSAQTVAVVPEFDDEGNIIGGTAVQRDGESRGVSLKRRSS